MTAEAAVPFVTIVVPHLNQPEQLARCLSSLARQDWPEERREIIVVDNGSRSVPDTAALGVPGVSVLREAAPGPGLARNTGVAAGRGDHFLFIDADCRAGDGWIRAMMRSLTAPDATGVVGGDVRIDVADPARLTPLEAYESVFAYRQRLYIEERGFSGTGNLGATRAVIAAVGPFRGIDVAEDMDWGRRAVAAGRPPRFVPDAVVYHPARRTMAELEAKWRRHVAHERALRTRPVGWRIRALAVLLSAIPHGAMLMASPRLTGLRNRIRGLRVLYAIRLFRFREMWRGDAVADGATSWNRA